MIIKQKTTKLIKTVFALTLLFALALTALVGCGNGEEASGAESSKTAGNDSVAESSEAVTPESSEADESSEAVYAESSSEDGDESEDSSEPTESDSSSLPEDESSEPESSTPDEESSEPVTEPEIIGEGTKESPYLLFPDGDMTLTTYELDAEETQYYGIYRVGGMNLTVNSEDLYIVCDGKKYAPKEGVLQFRVVAAMASDSIVFQITNTSSEKQTFKLSFANPVGTFANPVSMTIGKDSKISLEKNDDVGYYYKYIAEKDGVIVFTVKANEKSILAVTNNRNSAQRTTEDDGNENDDGSKYVEIEVQTGDELIINVGALPINKRGDRPAIDITVSGEYK